MKNEDHVRTTIMIIGLAKQIQKLDLEMFLKSIDEIEIRGPELSPENFIKAKANMLAMKELAIACQDIAKKMDRLKDAISIPNP